MRFASAGAVVLVFFASLCDPVLGRKSRLVTRGVAVGAAATAVPTAGTAHQLMQCPSSTTACARHRSEDKHGGGSRSSPTTFECIDTDSDYRSCGGCRFPAKGGEQGEDCTKIEGASEAYCECGACVVRSCRPGYFLDSSATFCAWHGISNQDFRDNKERGGGWWFFL
ncbi:hypothetical protein C8R44DRAFT_870682 [Mycena epipterygia]|nr:hypothetical protein C8R44DRAFT_870682 [Mycena epipterygia]